MNIQNGSVVEWVGGVSYDFKGKAGISAKALLTTWKDGLCVRAELVKVSQNCKIRVGDSGGVCLYDRFGRFAGFGG